MVVCKIVCGSNTRKIQDPNKPTALAYNKKILTAAR